MFVVLLQQSLEGNMNDELIGGRNRQSYAGNFEICIFFFFRAFLSDVPGGKCVLSIQDGSRGEGQREELEIHLRPDNDENQFRQRCRMKLRSSKVPHERREREGAICAKRDPIRNESQFRPK